MNTLKNWLAAAVMALLIAASWQLDGPSDTETAQLTADAITQLGEVK